MLKEEMTKIKSLRERLALSIEEMQALVDNLMFIKKSVYTHTEATYLGRYRSAFVEREVKMSFTSRVAWTPGDAELPHWHARMVIEIDGKQMYSIAYRNAEDQKIFCKLAAIVERKSRLYDKDNTQIILGEFQRLLRKPN